MEHLCFLNHAHLKKGKIQALQHSRKSPSQKSFHSPSCWCYSQCMLCHEISSKFQLISWWMPTNGRWLWLDRFAIVLRTLALCAVCHFRLTVLDYLSSIDNFSLRPILMSKPAPLPNLNAMLLRIKDIQTQWTMLKDGQSLLKAGQRHYKESQRCYEGIISRVLKCFDSFDKQIEQIVQDHKEDLQYLQFRDRQINDLPSRLQH